MRFRRLRADAFGVLRGREIDLSPGAVLVFGSNESGKTTFRSALETILYGFDPAEREAHPLAPWAPGAGADLLLEAALERELGPPLRVERTLLARGHLRLAEGDADFESRRLGNVPLDFVRDLPRELFRSVYSLELAQLAALEKDAQARVDDLLLPQASGLGLRPVAELREALREAHQALWRPDRRGNPEAQRLGKDLEGLRLDAAEAAREERALRDALTEQAELQARLSALDARRAELEREHEDAPFLRDLFELARRRRSIGAPIDLSALGELPLVEPTALAREIAELGDAIREPEARLARAPEALEPGQGALLAAASDVAVARATASELRSEAKQCAERRAEVTSLRDEARRELASVLARAPGDAELEAVKAVPLEVLRAAHANWVAATERHAASAPPHLPSWAWLAVVACAAFAALAWLLAPWLGDALRNLAIGVVAIAALVACASWLAHLRRGVPQAPMALTRWFADLPPSPELLARPSELARFVERIAAARTTLSRARGEASLADTAEASLSERTLRLAELCGRLGLETEGGADQCSGRLGAALERALATEKRVEQERAERRVAQERLDATRPRLERALRHLEPLEAVLREAEPTAPTLAHAFARVKERIEEAEFLRRREAELRRDPRFAAFEHDPCANAARDPAGAEWGPEATARRDRERADCARQLAESNTRLGEIANLLRSDPGGRQARAADGLREVMERLEAVRHERDRLALLEAIVARAEVCFREEHQPPVLQRASSHLDRMTHGRWRRLHFEAGSDGGLFVAGAGRDEPVRAAPPLSRGTLDQIFLCLRLGLIDHLDEGRERLPLVLDDALLRIDDSRRPEVYALLSEITATRQVFLLTCQEWIAAEAERSLGLGRVTLAS